MSRLRDLFDQEGQSPWLDNLKREWIANGELARWVERGARGLTSNPAIFQKAIDGSADYDDQFGSLMSGGSSIEDAYWELVSTDIGGALRALAAVHADSDGRDGYVSVEVDPALARDTAASGSMLITGEVIHSPTGVEPSLEVSAIQGSKCVSTIGSTSGCVCRKQHEL